MYKITQLWLMLIFIPALFFAISKNGVASYTTTYTSAPYSGSGFSYSDQSGNSISYKQTQAVPVIIYQNSRNAWVWMNNGNIPAGAIVLQYINGFPVYQCRVQSRNAFYYGKLFHNQGCYIPNISNRPLNTYQVLIRY